MAKPELGLKRVCVACNARFYDMTKAPPVCPKCGTEQPLDQPRIRRAGGNVAEDKRAKKPAAAPGIEDVEVEGVEEAEDEGVLSLTLAFNGDPISSAALDNFAFEVKERFKARKSRLNPARNARPEARLLSA